MTSDMTPEEIRAYLEGRGIPPIGGGAQTISLGQQAAFGVAGVPFKATSLVQLGIGANQVIGTGTKGSGTAGTVVVLGPGWFMCVTSANDIVQYTPDAGVTFITMIPSSSWGIFYTDGQNIRLFNNTGVADAGAVNSKLTQVDII